MARKRSQIKTKRRLIFLVSTSLVIVFTLLFTIGGYWVDIISKYKEKQVLEQQLVDHGLLAPAEESVSPEDIESMMNQANALYSAGKVEEAQEMYNKISELNKKVQGK